MAPADEEEVGVAVKEAFRNWNPTELARSGENRFLTELW